MARFAIFCVLVASLTVGATLISGGEAAAAGEVEALYVFGDSYADTGNHDPESEAASIYKPWREPYGSTWPGIPSGRYSNGHVFTDLFASYMGLKTPILFRLLNISTTSNEEEKEDARVMTISRGINFAFGGSGVFSTLDAYVPNVTIQIQKLNETLELGIVNINNLSKALALLTINGNDYTAYYEEHQTFTGVESLIPEVVEQMAYDLENLSHLGFTNFVVTNIGPVGCLPYLTQIINYSACIEKFNNLSDYHNNLLASKISDLQEKIPEATFLTLDFNSSINEVIQEGALSMTPCCKGVSGGSCGKVNESGSPLYTVCSDVNASLYWDVMHPTNYGWIKITKILFQYLENTYHLPLAFAKL